MRLFGLARDHLGENYSTRLKYLPHGVFVQIVVVANPLAVAVVRYIRVRASESVIFRRRSNLQFLCHVCLSLRCFAKHVKQGCELVLVG